MTAKERRGIGKASAGSAACVADLVRALAGERRPAKRAAR